VLLVNPAFPTKTVAEFIAYAKANPGKLNMASSGTGNLAHLSGELLKRAAGIEMTHIVYRGAGPALADVLAGQVDLMFASMVSSLHHAKSGKLKALAVTSPKRSSVVPEYPTVSEAGVPGFEMVGYFGLLAPANTPAMVVKTVHQAVQRAIKRRDFIERISADGLGLFGRRSDVDIEQCDLRAGLCECPRCCCTDGAASPGDDGDLTGKGQRLALA